MVTPGATFSDATAVPSDAIVLFDGHDLSHWTGDNHWTANKPHPQWKVQDGYMENVPNSGYLRTKEDFGDFQLHVEWAAPAKVEGNSQTRGNSGIFLQDIYEVQILDSYDNPTYADGQCGALYGQSPGLANACRVPGAWQTYDIIFEAARFGADHQLIRPASVTVLQNGVLLHHKQAYLGATGHGIAANYNKQ